MLMFSFLEESMCCYYKMLEIMLCEDCVKRGTFSWSRRDKGAAFPAGTLCLVRVRRVSLGHR